MLDLFKTYSMSEIITFIIILCLAIKGIVDFIEWAINKISKPFDKKNNDKEIQKKVLETLEAHSSTIEEMSKSINILINSDKDDIKAWITEKHHYFCYQLGYIDDYNFHCIESRYQHYKEEKGNTFIDAFMEDIRNLPKVSVSAPFSKDAKKE